MTDNTLTHSRYERQETTYTKFSPSSLSIRFPDQFDKSIMSDPYEIISKITPDVELNVVYVEIDDIIEKLIHYEEKFGRSTIEIFSDFINGNCNEINEEIIDWYQEFLLFLLTNEIRNISCGH